ncbi:hypothetical protein AVEN_46247-1 [Araneus ventricosus]|uniref:Uncharacterized protein n=1 Tax=Araneus ventricosus TaxID=182803 RepID=A0A4Y2F8Y2_ARAVE|nr:hypothetical protein AVEN_46247-1 [Araneus ventricosus]
MHLDNPGKSGHAPTLAVTQIQQNRDDFICMQDGAPPHFYDEVQKYLYDTILTLCNFYLREYIKDRVYVSPMPVTLQDLRDRIVTAVSSMTRDQLLRQICICRKWISR